MIKTNTMIKILTMLIMVVMISGMMSVFNENISYAAKDSSAASSLAKEITQDPGESGDTTDITSKAASVVGMIRTIAVIAGVIILTVLGVQYMLGSVEQKAEYKKTLVPLVIGIIVVMGSTQIATMIFSFTANK